VFWAKTQFLSTFLAKIFLNFDPWAWQIAFYKIHLCFCLFRSLLKNYIVSLAHQVCKWIWLLKNKSKRKLHHCYLSVSTWLEVQYTRYLNFGQNIYIKKATTLYPGRIRSHDLKSYHLIPWQDSISRPIAPVSAEADADDLTRPRRHGSTRKIYLSITLKILWFNGSRNSPSPYY
jgi:hypothetical protein